MQKYMEKLIAVSSWQRAVIALASILIPLGILALESLFFPGILFKNLEITPFAVMLGGWLLHGILRFRDPVVSHPRAYLGLIWSAVIIFFGSLFLIQLNALVHPTASLQYFHLHPEPLQYLTWFLTGLSVIYFRKDLVEKLHPWLTAVFPLLLLAIFMSLQHHYAHEVFAKLKVEDGPFEYGTFAAFLTGSFAAGYTAWRIWSTRYIPNFFSIDLWQQVSRWLLMLGFIGVSIAFFFVAGEEISWGQRILGIETPAEYAAVNTQQELTLHNHHAFINYVYYTYLILSLTAASAWIVVKKFALLGFKRFARFLEWLAPQWWLAAWFLPMIVYVPLRETFGYIRFGHWEEMSELFLSLGFLGHLLYTAVRARSLQDADRT